MNTEMLTLFGIANCDTIKKTRNWLAEHGVVYTFHDYKKQGIDAALARQMLNALPIEELINKRGTTWRKLPAQLQEELNTDNVVTLMLAHPSVIRRPVLQCGQRWLAGYDEAQLAEFISTHRRN